MYDLRLDRFFSALFCVNVVSKTMREPILNDFLRYAISKESRHQLHWFERKREERVISLKSHRVPRRALLYAYD